MEKDTPETSALKEPEVRDVRDAIAIDRENRALIKENEELKRLTAGGPSLAAALMELPNDVEKDKEHSHYKYKYATADAVFGAVRKVLAKEGLAVWMQQVSFELEEILRTVTNKKTGEVEANGVHRLYAKVTFEFAITPDGKRPADGEGELFFLMDEILGVQSFMKIRTLALKYWLRTKGLISTGEGDADESDHFDKNEKPGAEKTQQPKEKSTGKWTLDDKTFKYEESGNFLSEADAQRELTSKLLKDLGPKADSKRASAIYLANLDLIKTLTKHGQKTLEGRHTAALKRLESGTGPAAETSGSVQARWKLNQDSLVFEPVGTYATADGPEKQTALFAELKKVLEKGKDPVKIHQCFMANEENIKGVLTETQQDELFVALDKVVVPPQEEGKKDNEVF